MGRGPGAASLARVEMSRRPLAELPPPPPREWRFAPGPWAVAALLAGGCAYVALRDPSTNTTFPACPFKSFTGWDCPGCGMTRAAYSLMHLDVAGAANHNLLFVVALPLVLWMLADWFLRESSGRGLPTVRWPGWATIAVGAAVVAFGVLRNTAAFSWLDAVA